ncbi:MAG: FAD-binding oxidoreductase [Azospirillaceae bacterium]
MTGTGAAPADTPATSAAADLPAPVAAVLAELEGVPAITEPALVKQKSRDFYWYSPILKRELRGKYGDAVVVPRDEAEVLAVARACVRHRVPLTVRGAGTGNYGQAMPLEGGVILETTALDRIETLSDGVLTVGAGKRLIDLEAETIPQGWELRFHPSTRRTATIGGFVAGGSTGVGAINYGLLRDRGSVLGLRVVTLEDDPRVLVLEGDDVLKATHAYGCNGIITQVTLPLAPAWPWVDVMAGFDDFEAAMDFCDALASADPIVKKLITPIDAPVAQDFFRPLKPFLSDGEAVVLMMIAAGSMAPLRTLLAERGGRLAYEARPGEGRHEGEEIPPLYEFTWNHTTLQALKLDKSISYLQTLFPPEVYRDKVRHMRETFGDEVPMHLEYVRLGGRIACFGLQLVRYTDDDRLNAIIAYHEDHGCPVFNPHTHILEDGGMKEIDADQLAFKRLADPYGLANPGKMRAWWETGAG